MNLIRIVNIIALVTIISLCITLICLTIKLDDDSSVFTNYFIICCSAIFILLSLLEGIIYIIWPHPKNTQIPRTILFILAILSILYLAITQISHAFLDDNGSGKVPIIDPHDEDWYKLKRINKIIQYSTCILVIASQVILGWKKKRISCNDISSLVIEENQQENIQTLITSQQQESIENQQSNQSQNSHPPNTFESKNTHQVQAIKKLNNIIT